MNKERLPSTATIGWWRQPPLVLLGGLWLAAGIYRLLYTDLIPISQWLGLEQADFLAGFVPLASLIFAIGLLVVQLSIRSLRVPAALRISLFPGYVCVLLGGTFGLLTFSLIFVYAIVLGEVDRQNVGSEA